MLKVVFVVTKMKKSFNNMYKVFFKIYFMDDLLKYLLRAKVKNSICLPDSAFISSLCLWLSETTIFNCYTFIKFLFFILSL